MKRAWRQILKCSTVAALLLQAFLWAAHAPNLAIVRTAQAGPLSPIIVICTGTTPKKVLIDRDGNPVDLPGNGDVGEACQICTTLGGLDATAAGAPQQITHIDSSVRHLAHSRGDRVSNRRPRVRCGLDPPRSI